MIGSGWVLARLFACLVSCTNKNSILLRRSSLRFNSFKSREIGAESDQLSYQLLDSGAYRKLERFGNVLVDRACPAANWPKQMAHLWKPTSILKSIANDSHSGSIPWVGPTPSEWQLKWKQVCLSLQPSNNGQQIGIFPEHSVHWNWIQRTLEVEACRRRILEGNQIRVLNCFAYTGAATLAAAAVEGVQVRSNC